MTDGYDREHDIIKALIAPLSLSRGSALELVCAIRSLRFVTYEPAQPDALLEAQELIWTLTHLRSRWPNEERPTAGALPDRLLLEELCQKVPGSTATLAAEGVSGSIRSAHAGLVEGSIRVEGPLTRLELAAALASMRLLGVLQPGGRRWAHHNRALLETEEVQAMLGQVYIDLAMARSLPESRLGAWIERCWTEVEPAAL